MYMKKSLVIKTKKDLEKFYKRLWLYRSFLYRNVTFILKEDKYNISNFIMALNIKNRRKRIEYIYSLGDSSGLLKIELTMYNKVDELENFLLHLKDLYKFDKYGKLVGVMNAQIDGKQNYNMGIYSCYLLELIEKAKITK